MSGSIHAQLQELTEPFEHVSTTHDGSGWFIIELVWDNLAFGGATVLFEPATGEWFEV